MLTIQKRPIPFIPTQTKTKPKTQHKHPRQPPPNPKPHLKTRDPEQQKAQPIDIHRSQSIQGTSHHPKASTGSSSHTLPPSRLQRVQPMDIHRSQSNMGSSKEAGSAATKQMWTGRKKGGSRRRKLANGERKKRSRNRNRKTPPTLETPKTPCFSRS